MRDLINGATYVARPLCMHGERPTTLVDPQVIENFGNLRVEFNNKYRHHGKGKLLKSCISALWDVLC